jgi:uncharacterized protein with HEPN domain
LCIGSAPKNTGILERIIEYCNRIDATKARYGNSVEALENDYDHTGSVAMSVLQIGELTTHLTTDFKKQHSGVPWQDIVAMRNMAAHHYGQFRLPASPPLVHDEWGHRPAPGLLQPVHRRTRQTAF